LLMILTSLLRGVFNLKIILLSLCYLIVLIIHIPISFNINAATEEFVRFMFLPVVLIYGYSCRRNINMMVLFIIIMAMLSDLVQLYSYLHNFFNIGPNIIDNEFYVKDGGYFFNVGFLGISNAIINLSAFVLVSVFIKNKFKTILLILLFMFTFLTFSYKTIPFLFAAYFLFNKVGRLKAVMIVSLFISLSYVAMQYVLDMYEILLRKIDVYMVAANSARAESYRVMVEFISGFNLLGEGLGGFGGPASVKYNSPIYNKYNFNWYNTTTIQTTDTFYPHLFVELGIIGGIIFLILLFQPIATKCKKAFVVNTFLMSALMFESIFSFGLLSLVHLVCTVMLFYGVNDKFMCDRGFLILNSHIENAQNCKWLILVAILNAGGGLLPHPTRVPL